MSEIVKKTFLPLSAIITAGVFLIFVLVMIVSNSSHADSNSVNKNGRILTIFDRGQERTFISEADNVGDALVEAGIELDQNDIVEPEASRHLIASSYSINIYRARPVIISDGSVKIRTSTPYQTVEQIVAGSGIELHPEDIATLSRSNDVVADGAGLQIDIDRAVAFEFTLYGKTDLVRTQGETVGEMLSEKGIVLADDDRIQPSVDTAIEPNMSVKLWREGKQVVTANEAIKFNVETIKDADRNIGYREIRIKGIEGARNVSYEVTIQDGVEVNRTEIASVTTLEPVTQVEVVGALLPYTGSGTKTEWLIAAGIDESDWAYVDYIISHESSWNPNAINKSSGACGLAQALPCSKVPGNPLDPIDSLKWANAYAQTCVSYRMYCGWEGAYDFWVKNQWW